MKPFSVAIGTLLISAATAYAQPTYSKDIRPFLAKYCLECHNAKTMKGTLNLETYKAMMDGTDRAKVIKLGQPNASKLVLVCEGKEKPLMPPAKAKFRPSKDEVAMLRAWVAAGAQDDGSNIKIVLPAIKPGAEVLPPVTAIALVADVALVIARNRMLSVFNLEERDRSETIIAKTNITCIAVEPKTPDIIAIGSQPGELSQLLVYEARGKVSELKSVIDLGHADAILDCAFASNRRVFATAGYDSQVRIFSNQLGKTLHILKEHSDAVYGLAFNPNGALLASVSADRALKVTDVETGKLLYTLGEATDWLYTVAWSADGKDLVSGGVDKSIRVYTADAKGAKLRQSVFAHEGPIQKLLFSSDSKTLYSAGQDRIVKAWDVEKMVERKVYEPQPDAIMCLALREDAKQIIVGRYDGIVQLIDMQTGKVAHEFGKVMPKKSSALPATKNLVAFNGKVEDVRGQKAVSKPMPTASSAKNPGSSPATGQKIELPANINGTLDRAGTVHFFRFDVKAGQPLGVQIIKEAKAKFEPALIVADMNGRILAESYAGHLGHTFAQAGAFAIGVRDRDFRGGADFTYRLNLGAIPVVTAVFPLGMARGTKGTVQLDGVFLPKTSLPIAVPADAKLSDPIPLAVGDGVLGKAQIVIGEFPDATAGNKLAVPATANGRIQNENQSDLWSFQARKGQRLVVEVNARRIGSRLDSMIEILDKDLQPLPRAVLRSQAKTHVTFRDHDSAQGNIRIETWGELGSNDYLYVGNELMKIQALPGHPDADCSFFATAGQRVAYFDTTATHHANNSPMYKVSLHPPGTIFPPNGFPVFTLYYRNDDGGPGFGRDSRIIFDPPADGQYHVRIADARGMGGVNFGYRLTVRQPAPGFSLKATPISPSVPRGSAIPITITAERFDGFDGPILVNFAGVPKGLHMPATTIEAGTYSTTVALYAADNAKVSDKASRLLLEGYASGSGSRLLAKGEIDLPTLIEPGDIVTTTAESEVAIKPGAQAKLLVRIERKNGFKGRVPLDVKGLPHGVRVLDIGLNGILVNENETMRHVVLYAEPWVQPADRPFVVLARREGKNTEHAAKSVLLKVK